MALSMVTIPTNGFCRSSQAVLGGSLQLFCMHGSGKRLSMAKAGLAIRAQQVSFENETNRRSMLVGVAAAGLASGSFIQPLLAAEARLGIGGYQPFPVTSPCVPALAYFAVAEYNKKPVPKLEVVEILSAEYQVVNGTNYRLQIRAKEVGQNVAFDNHYEAIVFADRSGLQLISFVPSNA